jgi:hypothetical protein
VADLGEKLEGALLELRAQALFRLAQMLKIQVAVSDVRELVGHLSDREVLEHLTVQQNRSPPREKQSHWWSAFFTRLRRRPWTWESKRGRT